MGFWPFGRDPAEIEIVTRVITAATQNGVKVRGKLTIHFGEPQRQTDADAAADRCATVAIALLREAPEHQRLIGAETQLNAQLLARYPGSIPPARAVELAALHVVGDPTLSDELRRASSSSLTAPLSTPTPPRSGSPSSIPAPHSAGPNSAGPHSAGPNSAVPVSSASPLPPHAGYGAPPRRRGSSQIRSIQSLLMPPGSPPSAMGAFVAPMLRDSAARLLIGFFRAHDLVTLRSVTIDEGSAEMLANLVPSSDAAPGGYEASRAVEIARWSQAIGAEVVSALHHEVNVVSVFIARDVMSRAELNRTLAAAVVDAAVSAAFPDDAERYADGGRFPEANTPGFTDFVAHELARIAGCGDDPAAITAALRPLLALIQEDLATSAMIVKLSAG